MPHNVSWSGYFSLWTMTSVRRYDHYKYFKIIEHQLNRNFPNFCNWFVDSRLSIHFGEHKTKSILFAPLNKCRKFRKLNNSCDSLKVKQNSEVIYLGCIWDKSLSRESITLNLVSKINRRLKFLHGRKQTFVTSIKAITM